jgi:Zinc finger, C3HC4 type (RING finger)
MPLSREDWVVLHTCSALVSLAFAAGFTKFAFTSHTHLANLASALTASKERSEDADITVSSQTEAAKQRKEGWVAVTGQVVTPNPGAPVRPTLHPHPPFGSSPSTPQHASVGGLRALDGEACALVLEKDVIQQRGRGRIKFATARQVPWGIAPTEGAVANDKQGVVVGIDCQALKQSIEASPEEKAIELREGYREEKTPYFNNATPPFFGLKMLKQQLIVPLLSTITVVGTLTYRDGEMTLTAHPSAGMYLIGGGLLAVKDIVVGLYKKRNREVAVVAGLLGLSAVNIVSIVSPGFFHRAGRKIKEGLSSAYEAIIDWWSPHLRIDAERIRTEAQQRLQETVARNTSGTDDQQANEAAPGTIGVDCIVCYERKVDTAFNPCGHLGCCHPCATRINSSPFSSERKCPICRRNITSLLKVYTLGIAPPTAAAPTTSLTNTAAANGNDSGTTTAAAGGPVIVFRPLPQEHAHARAAAAAHRRFLHGPAPDPDVEELQRHRPLSPSLAAAIAAIDAATAAREQGNNNHNNHDNNDHQPAAAGAGAASPAPR